MDENKIGSDPEVVDWMTELHERGKKCLGCSARLFASDPDLCELCDLHRDDEPFYMGGMSIREDRIASQNDD